MIYWKVFFQKPLRLFRILALFHLKRPKNSFSNYFLPLFQNREPISDVACTMWLSPIYFNSIECISNKQSLSTSIFRKPILAPIKTAWK
ncbi:Eukaryotic translation initiation factor 3 subunit E [Gossypium arboreum]|uniref:Eukaryotic translation initiation factor 3 subunit E n=1 Tax=Gossypium arboreum TaxID=29729 RepID=A0A0B0PV63_GOSAR|nr:Eukaryotic translation initiation factor 3 subunit E [Gossypium arboreum]